MGSLLPGWDAAHSKPKGFDEFDETQEPQPKGYFANYERAKSLRHGPDVVGGSAGGGYTRLSAAPSIPISSGRSSMDSAPRMACSLDRATSLGGKKYTMTDWSSELDSLRPKPLNTLSVGSDASRRLSEEPGADPHKAGWWAHLESGALNTAATSAHDAALAEERPGAHKSTFCPQFNLTRTSITETAADWHK